MNSTSSDDPGGTRESTSEAPTPLQRPSDVQGAQGARGAREARPTGWSNDELIPFGKYILLNKLSAGATAAVYRAKLRAEPGFERIVTIKRILPQMAGDSEFVETFVEEAKLCARLTHGNICPIYELGKVGESLYMALQWVAGKDLGAIIRRIAASGQTLPPTAAAWIASRLCDALDYAHSMKDASGKPLAIVHQDLSPANIVVSYEGEVKLLDFGIARATGRAQQTNVDALKQKLGYMSPELVHGEVPDARSDVFGIGVCLFEMVTGQRLFAGADDIATLKLVSAAAIKAPSSVHDGIPAALEAIILRALAREPDGRWASAGEMANALAEYVASADASYGTHSLTELMHGLFEADIIAERIRLHELITASQDPQLIEQRRRFFASPAGAAAVAKAEAARRAKASAPPPVARSVAGRAPAQSAQSTSGPSAARTLTGTPAVSVPPAQPAASAGDTARLEDDEDALTHYHAHAALRPTAAKQAAAPVASADDDEPTSFLTDIARVERAARAPVAQPQPAPPMAAGSRPGAPLGAPLGAGATIPGIAPQTGAASASGTQPSTHAPAADSALALIAKVQDVAQFEEQATQIFFSHEHGFGLPDVPAEVELSPSVPAPLRMSGPAAAAAAPLARTRPKTRPPAPPPAHGSLVSTRAGSSPGSSTSLSASSAARPVAVTAGVTQRVKRRYNIVPNQATQRLKPLKQPAPAPGPIASLGPNAPAISVANTAASNMANLPTLQLSAAAAARQKLPWVVAGTLAVMAAVAFTYPPIGIALGLRKPPHGVLDIRTAPSVSASILIDGTYRGRAPMRLEGIPAGSRVLELEAEGYERVSRLIAVEGGAVVTENVQLSSLQNAAASVR